MYRSTHCRRYTENDFCDGPGAPIYSDRTYDACHCIISQLSRGLCSRPGECKRGLKSILEYTFAGFKMLDRLSARVVYGPSGLVIWHRSLGYLEGHEREEERRYWQGVRTCFYKSWDEPNGPKRIGSGKLCSHQPRAHRSSPCIKIRDQRRSEFRWWMIYQDGAYVRRWLPLQRPAIQSSLPEVMTTRHQLSQQLCWRNVSSVTKKRQRGQSYVLYHPAGLLA